jgi:hypothetical protein
MNKHGLQMLTSPLTSSCLKPDNGKPINENKKTEVKVLYDNDAVYISHFI